MSEKAKHVWLESPAGLSDYEDATSALNELLWQQTLDQKTSYGARCAQLARERIEKRLETSSTEPKLRRDATGWVCENCQAKDAEITKLKAKFSDVITDLQKQITDSTGAASRWNDRCIEARDEIAKLKAIPVADGHRLECSECKRLRQDLKTIYNGYHTAIDDVTKLKAALAEAQAKAIQPGDVVLRPDGEPRSAIAGDWLMTAIEGDFYKASCGYSNSTTRQAYKRIQ